MAKKNTMEFDTEKEYEYVYNNGKELSKYDGKWIAVLDESVVESDVDLKKVWDSFQAKFPNRIPFIMKVVESPLLL